MAALLGRSLGRRMASAWVLALFACALWPATARPQAAPEAPVFYVNFRTLRVPFTPPGDSGIVRLNLYVSEDLGRTWHYATNASPADRGFPYTAVHDGWFFFAVQTQDTANQLSPETARLTPGLKVCVDTARPVIALRPATPREGSVAIEWDIQDENLDPATLRIDYRPLGSRNENEWLPLRVQQVARGDQGWTPPYNVPVEVRLYVRDRAKNDAIATTSVTPGAARGAPPPPPGGAGVPGGPPTQHVRNKEFQLRFNVEDEGPSGVDGVDVWVTRDSLVWQKQFQLSRTSPEVQIEKPANPGDKAQGVISVKVPSSGRWGFTLILRSGVGLSEPDPRRGDPPHVWIEVDDTAPTITLLNVIVDKDPPYAGRMTVYWKASDPFLRARPIVISYSDTPSGPWKELAKDLENTGSWMCDPKAQGLPYKFYLKIDAMDEAGNAGSVVSSKPVNIDLARPRATNVGVAAPRSSAPPGDVLPKAP